VVLPGQQVVHLHQVEARHAPEAARSLDLGRTARAVSGPHLLGREQGLRLPQPCQRLADHRLRRAVHRARVDQPPAFVEERSNHLEAGFATDTVGAHIEGDPAAQAHHRQRLARAGYRLRQRRCRLRAQRPGSDGKPAQASQQAEHVAASSARCHRHALDDALPGTPCRCRARRARRARRNPRQRQCVSARSGPAQGQISAASVPKSGAACQPGTVTCAFRWL
jgi:hypothetical protein